MDRDPVMFLLPEPAKRWIVEYLSQRPWREVADIIPALLTLRAQDAAGLGVAGVQPTAPAEKKEG